ncbi:hypothetical protein PVNG_05256 [Plasmodium vivax North Korean]|uniref:Uncharacterized protein n=1 Tax=Plasmodium vivax North Korean TaxID=1035514 RepID=A0A0J9TSG5_PLAVI|nr:hypothetical protein PVNG_05256 [Plasmodium vivax North Korean]
MSVIINKEYDSNDELCHLDPQVPYDNNWKAKKEFYEYCYDKDVVEFINKINGSTCTKYQNFLEKKTELYNNVDEILSDKNLNKCTYSYEKGDKCDPKVLLKELIPKEEVSEAGHQSGSEQNLTGGSSISFLGLPDKRTASTAASVAGVSLLGLALYRVRRNVIY